MRYLISVGFILLLVAIPLSASADEEGGPSTYTKTSVDGKYIFVMLAPPGSHESTSGPKAATRAKYSQSGLYRNDGSTTPLWAVDWYAYGVEVSSDGRHLVRWGPWPRRKNHGELAVAFYEDGRELKSYRVNELVADPGALLYSSSHYMWLHSYSFDDDAGRLTVDTLTCEKYVFNATTGEIVDWTSVDRARMLQPSKYDILDYACATWPPTDSADFLFYGGWNARILKLLPQTGQSLGDKPSAMTSALPYATLALSGIVMAGMGLWVRSRAATG